MAVALAKLARMLVLFMVLLMSLIARRSL